MSDTAAEARKRWGHIASFAVPYDGILALNLADELVAAEARVAATEREVLERIIERGDLRLLGLPLDDLKDIYKLVSEWTRLGGRPSMLESSRERAALEARVAALTRVIPSLISFALAAPTNGASEQARDAAVERARAALDGLVGLHPEQPQKCPRCYGKGLENQDDRPGILLGPLGEMECRECGGSGLVGLHEQEPT